MLHFSLTCSFTQMKVKFQTVWSEVATGNMIGHLIFVTGSSIGDGGTSTLFPWYGIIRWHPRQGGTSTIYIFMAPLTLFNEAPKRKSVAPMALKNAFLWLSWPSLMRGYQLTFLYVGVFGVPAHFLIYGKDTRFLFVKGCSR